MGTADYKLPLILKLAIIFLLFTCQAVSTENRTRVSKSYAAAASNLNSNGGAATHSYWARDSGAGAGAGGGAYGVSSGGASDGAYGGQFQTFDYNSGGSGGSSAEPQLQYEAAGGGNYGAAVPSAVAHAGIEAAHAASNSGGGGFSDGYSDGLSGGNGGFSGGNGGFNGGNGGSSGGNGGYGGGGGSSYGPPSEKPVYKYKYHIYPHQKPSANEGWGWGSSSNNGMKSNMKSKGKGGGFLESLHSHDEDDNNDQDDHHGMKGGGGGDGWGWGDDEDMLCKRQGNCDEKGGGGGGLSGLAGLAGLLGLKGVVGLLPLALLLLPLLLLIPLPFFYFPPGTLDPTNGVLKLGRNFGPATAGEISNVTLSTEMENSFKFDSATSRLWKQPLRAAKNFAWEIIKSYFGSSGRNSKKSLDHNGGGGKSKSECIERMSCELYGLARNFKMDKYIDTAFHRILPFKPLFNNVASSVARGIQGECLSYTCSPFFLTESH